MNLFQSLTLPALAVALAAELVGLARKPTGRKVRLLRAGVWTAAALAIVHPELPQTIANHIGIGRGADLVLYLFVLAFLSVSFYFYSRFLRLREELTDVVRHLAIQNARLGQEEANEDRQTPQRFGPC
jgi:hypothetical protein